jgi:ubiquinone/menaquinone biosynthesis C-methylase UbiE
MSDHGLKTPEEVLDQFTGIWRSGILRAALELNVADHILAGRDTPAAIAEAEGAEPRAVGILLDAVCALGFADKVDGRYRLEPAAEAMLAARPGSFKDASPIWLNEIFWSAWWRLPEAVRTGRPVVAAEMDHPFWAIFARASFGVAQLQGTVAAGLLGIAPGARTRVLDVGCGSGGVGYALALADPTATVTGLDGRTVLPIAAEHAATLGIADRVTHRVTDIFTAAGLGDAEFDVAIVSHILHGCAPAVARTLLRKVARAVVPRGRILINEFVPDEERRRAAFALMFGVLMLLGSAGNTYTLSEISGWLAEAGFTGVAHHPTIGHASAIIATKR